MRPVPNVPFDLGAQEFVFELVERTAGLIVLGNRPRAQARNVLLILRPLLLAGFLRYHLGNIFNQITSATSDCWRPFFIVDL